MLAMRAAQRKSRIRLKKRERLYLFELTSAGEGSARVFKRARVLLLLDKGWRPTDVPAAAGVGEATARRVRARYEAEGLEAGRSRSVTPGGYSATEPSRSDLGRAEILVRSCCNTAEYEPPRGQGRQECLRCSLNHRMRSMQSHVR